MMDKIYLHLKDLEQIIKFMNAFESDLVLVSSDTSSGIGPVITAKITGVDLNGMKVNVEKVIVNEHDW